MQIQTSLGLAGVGATKSTEATSPAGGIQALPPEKAVAPEHDVQGRDAKATVSEDRDEAPPPEARPPVAPRARLAYDKERRQVYVEVLDRSTGDVMFTFPANQAKDALPGGLRQGSLVDQFA